MGNIRAAEWMKSEAGACKGAKAVIWMFQRGRTEPDALGITTFPCKFLPVPAEGLSEVNSDPVEEPQAFCVIF